MHLIATPPPRPAGRARVLLVIAPLILTLAGCSGSAGGGQDAATDSASTSASSPAAGSASASASASATQTPIPGQGDTLTYPGKDGKTALELLQQADPRAEVKGSGADAFVVGIDGRKADDTKKEFWALYVNGKQATVGAGSLKTKSGDTITWKLETY